MRRVAMPNPLTNRLRERFWLLVAGLFEWRYFATPPGSFWRRGYFWAIGKAGAAVYYPTDYFERCRGCSRLRTEHAAGPRCDCDQSEFCEVVR